MTGQATISANTAFSSGNGGDVTVRTDSLSMQGTPGNSSARVGITADAFSLVTPGNAQLGTGHAGVVNVYAGTLSLKTGAIISSASATGGDGGSVTVVCTQGRLSGKSQISASSDLTNAGSVQITAADSFQLMDGSSITTSAAENGGSITLKVGRLLYLLDSNIQGFAGNPQVPPGSPAPVIAPNLSGGNILIDPEFVILDNSFISANDLSPGGKDGNITNFANFFFTSNSLLHATGTIETTSPDLDLGGSLVTLPGNLVDVQSKLRESCARSINHEYSTLIVVGRGGTESAPEELQPDFGLRLNLPESGAGEAVR